MHMADSLISAQVGGVMAAVSAAAAGYSAAKIRRAAFSRSDGDERGGEHGLVPLMAVTGAFVFTAQMINFTIPGTGSSGHIGGGILLSAVLGGFPALLAMSAVLIIQCLFFADGGLLALGCNIFNIGVIPCLLIYPLVFRPIAGKPSVKLSLKRVCAAAVVSAVAALQLGAFSVVLETQLSGITDLPFAAFAALMQPIHLAIGLGEGAATAAILSYVCKARPETLDFMGKPFSKTAFAKNIFTGFAVLAVITGGVLSLFASKHPDGLEWATAKLSGAKEVKTTAQPKTALMPEYDFKNGSGGNVGTSVSGIVGGVMTFALASGTAAVITAARKHKEKEK